VLQCKQALRIAYHRSRYPMLIGYHHPERYLPDRQLYVVAWWLSVLWTLTKKAEICIGLYVL